MSTRRYGEHRDAVMAFFDGRPGSDETVEGEPAFAVADVAFRVRLSISHAQDALVDLVNADVLERRRRGRSFLYWRPAR
jgi:hypothetical protein